MKADINNLPKIYFKEAKEAKSLTQLLDFGYSFNSSYFVKTYKDEKCTITECNGYRRSFEDLLAICNTYFPNTTEEQLMKALIDIKMKYYFCNGICKIVFHRMGSWSLNRGFPAYRDNRFALGTYLPEELQEIYDKLKKL